MERGHKHARRPAAVVGFVLLAAVLGACSSLDPMSGRIEDGGGASGHRGAPLAVEDSTRATR